METNDCELGIINELIRFFAQSTGRKWMQTTRWLSTEEGLQTLEYSKTIFPLIRQRESISTIELK